ncbi:ATP-binding protein [Thalassospira sp. TSL5-1]|uniref:PAS domain-containing sensor histidine kinase n=1 Tax=Thalassospira sp. TSL5-1 TaxID=1544451 RepID=UPI00093A22A5|nr:ATP-binding protein [Thalassospira sp. TSL5-1]OKH87565.1 histidine kinase [Thalassospira sp. TSL5-1]
MFLTATEPSLSQRSLRTLRHRLLLLSLSGTFIVLLSFAIIQKTLYDSALEQGRSELVRLVSSISLSVAQANRNNLHAIPTRQDNISLVVVDNNLNVLHGSYPKHMAAELRQLLEENRHSIDGTLTCEHGKESVMLAYHAMPRLNRMAVVMVPKMSLLHEWFRGLALHAVLFTMILSIMGCLSAWLWVRLKRQHIRARDLAGHFNDVENSLSNFGCAVIGWRLSSPYAALNLRLNWPEVLGASGSSSLITANDFMNLLNPASYAQLRGALLEDRWPQDRIAAMVSLNTDDNQSQRFYLTATRHIDHGSSFVSVMLLETIGSQEICNPFEAYLQYSPEPAIAVDLQGILRGFSAAFEELLGDKVHFAIGTPFFEMFSDDQREEATKAFAACINGQKPDTELVFRMEDKDGNLCWLAWHCVGPIDGVMLGSARDVTDFVDNTEKLRRTLSQLKRSNEDLEQFAYVASHDLQEPLRMVTSYTQLLKRRYDGVLGPDADEYINYAVDGAKRMHKLITHLLEYAKTGSTGGLTDVDCNEVLNEAQADLKAAISETQAIITHEDLPHLYGNRIALSRLFQNLISNAIKYARPGVPPLIKVSAEQDPDKPDFWRFTMHDNGIGIHPEHAQRIFRLFQRLHKDEFSGTGLGLSLCRKIVEQHGGEIWLDTSRSISDPGATFIFTLRGSGE